MSALVLRHQFCMQAQALIRRTYLLKDIGLEIFFSGRNSLYLTFKTSADRDRIAGKPLEFHKAPKHVGVNFNASTCKHARRLWSPSSVSSF